MAIKLKKMASKSKDVEKKVKKSKVDDDDTPVKKSKLGKKSKLEKAEKKSKKEKKVKKSKKIKEVEVIKPIKQKIKKAELIEILMEGAEIDKVQAKAVVSTFETLIKGCLVKKSIGEFNFQGLFKLILKDVPAKKGGKKAVNRFTGEDYITKDKPATMKIKARALNKLKKSCIPE